MKWKQRTYRSLPGSLHFGVLDKFEQSVDEIVLKTYLEDVLAVVCSDAERALHDSVVPSITFSSSYNNGATRNIVGKNITNFAMARAPHCCPSSLVQVSIAVRPALESITQALGVNISWKNSTVYRVRASNWKLDKYAYTKLFYDRQTSKHASPEIARGVIAIVCAFCRRHDRLLRARVAKILEFSSEDSKTMSTSNEIVDLPLRLISVPTVVWLRSLNTT